MNATQIKIAETARRERAYAAHMRTTATVTVEIDHGDYDDIRQVANRRGMSVADYISEMVRRDAEHLAEASWGNWAPAAHHYGADGSGVNV